MGASNYQLKYRANILAGQLSMDTDPDNNICLDVIYMLD
jgi:hypothetical protein